jgi:hypothetical protein
MINFLRATPGIIKLIIIHGMLMLFLMLFVFPRDALIMMSSYVLSFYYALVVRRIYQRWHRPRRRSRPTVY